MYKSQYKDINITTDSKIVIGLGCSFTEGQGAATEELWEKYGWDTKEMAKSSEVLKSEQEWNWVSQLCKLYLKDYIPINFGMRGNGNRAAVKELYLHPQLGIEKAAEKIVIFLLSGIERFDFINREFHDHHHFYTMWPNSWDKTATNYNLWKEYEEKLWSDTFGYIELLLNIVEAQTWCKANNATLILGSAFRTGINPTYMRRSLGEKKIQELVDLINWDTFIRPQGYECMTDLLVAMENRIDLLGGGFYGWAMEYPKMTPKKYFTKCSHPSIYGHKVIAEVIYEYIVQNNIIKRNQRRLI